MTQTQSQVSVDPAQLQPILVKLGYTLLDFGSHWRTNAIYRGGDTKTSLRIYKNTGVWTDFSVGEKSYPFSKLIQLTTKGTASMGDLMSSLKMSEEFFYKKKDLIEMEEVYPESILEKLFPNYNFYTKKGFSEETLKLYKTGLAGAGKMYRRMVFPIYNQHKQIIGFSGRKVDAGNDQVPKWKHLGRRKNWVYPAHSNPEVEKSIIETGEVFLVEGIGDSIALYDSKYTNNLVTFGVGCSPALVSYLASLPIKKIYIVGNNDFDKKKNHGMNGAIKILMCLSYYFDFDQLEIKLPPEEFNDLSDAFESGFELETWYNNKTDKLQQLASLKDYVKDYMSSFKQKDVEKLFKHINSYE